jgi:hypothetical protein
MIPVPAGLRIWIATGHTDMRRYVACRIMRSPRRRCECCRGVVVVSLSIILWMALLLQHGDELVWWPEFAGAQCRCVGGG